MSVVFKDVLGCFFPLEGTASMQFNEEPREEQIGERKFGKCLSEEVLVRL